ncbi:MAG: type II toxin-antitoxin system Phd/YefM family antitoxin [Chloroflexota bacterium]
MDATIGAGEFKANKCLQLIDEVAEHRQPLIITKRGQPLAKLVPIESTHSPLGAMAGSVTREEDIISSLDVHWDVME